MARARYWALAMGLMILAPSTVGATCWYCLGNSCEAVTGGNGMTGCYQDTNYAPDGTIQQTCSVTGGSCTVAGGGVDCGWDWGSWGWRCWWNPAN